MSLGVINGEAKQPERVLSASGHEPGDCPVRYVSRELPLQNAAARKISATAKPPAAAAPP